MDDARGALSNIGLVLFTLGCSKNDFNENTLYMFSPNLLFVVDKQTQHFCCLTSYYLYSSKNKW